MNFYVKDRIISCDKTSQLIGENSNYKARFITDEEWEDKAVTARFINGEEFQDCLLDENMECIIPLEICRPRGIKVGLYTDSMTTTACEVLVFESIKSNTGVQASPSEDVYSQILKLINETNERIGGIESGHY